MNDLTWGIDDGADVWPEDATQSMVSDGDGFGDNISGNNADDCPNETGTSMQLTKGCMDADGDGWADIDDAFPDIPSQWLDSDGDGRGDNQSSGAIRVDNFPSDPDSWSVTVSLDCVQSKAVIDMLLEEELIVTCTISNEADISVVAILIWDMPIGMDTDDNRQILQFS